MLNKNKYIVMDPRLHTFYGGDSVHYKKLKNAKIYNDISEIPDFIKENLNERIINLNSEKDSKFIKEEIKYIKEILSNGYRKIDKRTLNSNLNRFEKMLEENPFSESSQNQKSN